MKPDERFLRQPKAFWAHVRSISEEVGYTEKGTGRIRVPTPSEITKALTALDLRSTHMIAADGTPTEGGKLLIGYYKHRAKVLNEFVEPHLMDAARAKKLFEKMCERYSPQACDIPWNKQKGDKKAPAYLSAIIAMLVRSVIKNTPCDFDPRSLTTFTHNGKPLRTLARRVDGAFPSVVNPIALWEIKEYYYTTTFGSRVADGVYETLLDGMELEELREHEKVDAKHYLMVDAHYTWWDCGKSYLCRIIDMLHMGYVDEVLFGEEVVDRLPQLAREWMLEYKERTEGLSYG